MTPELNKAARCYGLFVDNDSSGMGVQLQPIRLRESENRSDSNSGIRGEARIPSGQSRIACFLGVLHRPHPRVKDIVGVSRIVTLPDFQGLGLAYVLSDTVASAYRALGKRFHNYPNHPAYIRSHQRSRNYIQIKESGNFSPHRGNTSTVAGFGGKRCAVFMYVGPSMNLEEAKKLVNGGSKVAEKAPICDDCRCDDNTTLAWFRVYFKTYRKFLCYRHANRAKKHSDFVRMTRW